MKFNRSLLKKLLTALGLLLPLAFGLRIYTYWKELDITSGFFSTNGAGCLIFNIIGFAVFFLCLLLSFNKNGSYAGPKKIASRPMIREADSLLMQEEGVYEAEQDFPDYFLQGFAKKVAVWNGTFSAFSALLPGFGFVSYALAFLTDKEQISDPYHLIFAVLSLFSGAFFLVYAFRNSCEKSRGFAFFSLVPAFWCTVRMVVEYRDLTRFLNKSLYIGQFLFVISILVFFLYQGQILLGEESLLRPNSYAFSAVAAVFFGLTARLPVLFAVMGERISLDLVDASSLLMDLAITLFIGVKLAAVMKRH